MRGPLSLRSHLVLLVLGAVLPGALLTGLIVRRTLEQNRTVLENRLADTARVDAAALDREFNGTIRVLQTLAQSPSLEAGDLKTFWAEAHRAAGTQPGWDLLDVSRLTRGKVDLVRHRFEARTAIDRAVDMARPLVEKHGHALYVGIPETGLPIDADQDRIVQVLVNLLTNAARYTPPGGHLALTSDCLDGAVEIVCEDDGPGVPAEQVPTIFEPFIQGPRSIARQQGGLGLGLTLARSLTELHGGALRYEPVVPHGSRFVVSLPLAADRAIDEPASTLVEMAVTPRRVLLVDDNVDGLDMMRLALETKGHEVQSAGNGNDAVVVAAAFRPEVAVLDIGLPGIDGYELARTLRAAQPRLRLIALTGYGQDADALAAIQAGFDAHCTKPLTIAALLDQIDALVEADLKVGLYRSI